MSYSQPTTCPSAERGTETAFSCMSDRTRFGIWTLLAAIGWIAGLALAFFAIWHLWADWSRM